MRQKGTYTLDDAQRTGLENALLEKHNGDWTKAINSVPQFSARVNLGIRAFGRAKYSNFTRTSSTAIALQVVAHSDSSKRAGIAC